MIQHVVVLGAGAIGSLYGAKLSKTCDVTLVARPLHADAITRSGLRIVGLENASYTIRAVSRLTAIEPETVVLICTKAHDTARAVSDMVALLRDDTIVVCIQNGLGSEEAARKIIGGRTLVLRAITQFGAIFRQPGTIDFRVAGYTLLERSDRSVEVAQLLTRSGLDGRVSDSIKTEIWQKLICNCVINPITAILGREVGAIADPRLAPLEQLVALECLSVARAEGVELDVDFVAMIAEVFGPSTNVASMLQDLRNGKPTEIEYMNGAIAALGVARGIPCPVNHALTEIIKAMEQSRSAVRSG